MAVYSFVQPKLPEIILKLHWAWAIEFIICFFCCLIAVFNDVKCTTRISFFSFSLLWAEGRDSWHRSDPVGMVLIFFSWTLHSWVVSASGAKPVLRKTKEGLLYHRNISQYKMLSVTLEQRLHDLWFIWTNLLRDSMSGPNDSWWIQQRGTTQVV
jgi:hypothetical protein